MSNSLIDIPVSKYYFDTFVVGSHHSLPHMVADLKLRKEMASSAINSNIDEFRKDQYAELIKLIDDKLSTINPDDVDNIEIAEPIFWVNELARRSAIEINTYGRIRPETLSLLLCVSEEDFGDIMKIASGITNRLKLISNLAESSVTPVPQSMPVKE